MRFPVLLFIGDSDQLSPLQPFFMTAGLTVVLPPQPVPPAGIVVDAVLQVLSPGAELTPFNDLPWFAWMQSNNHALTLAAYQAGARAVFPPDTPPEVLAQAIQRAVSEARQANPDWRVAIERRYQRGDFILLEADTVLQVQSGVLATAMVHQDGSEVLLGLSGAGQMVIAHPADNCHIQIMAHTDALVSIQDWETARSQPDFTEKLRARLQQMEGWAAMQARPYLDQRILGILGLLAGQFGRHCDQGITIDLRITHAQLASAVGATRNSITRVLGDLRTQGKLAIVSINNEDRFCLCEWDVNGGHRNQ